MAYPFPTEVKPPEAASTLVRGDAAPAPDGGAPPSSARGQRGSSAEAFDPTAFVSPHRLDYDDVFRLLRLSYEKTALAQHPVEQEASFWNSWQQDTGNEAVKDALRSVQNVTDRRDHLGQLMQALEREAASLEEELVESNKRLAKARTAAAAARQSSNPLWSFATCPCDASGSPIEVIDVTTVDVHGGDDSPTSATTAPTEGGITTRSMMQRRLEQAQMQIREQQIEIYQLRKGTGGGVVGGYAVQPGQGVPPMPRGGIADGTPYTTGSRAGVEPDLRVEAGYRRVPAAAATGDAPVIFTQGLQLGSFAGGAGGTGSPTRWGAVHDSRYRLVNGAITAMVHASQKQWLGTIFNAWHTEYARRHIEQETGKAYGWKARVDQESGRVYYWNIVTYEARWDRPTLEEVRQAEEQMMREWEERERAAAMAPPKTPADGAPAGPADGAPAGPPDGVKGGPPDGAKAGEESAPDGGHVAALIQRPEFPEDFYADGHHHHPAPLSPLGFEDHEQKTHAEQHPQPQEQTQEQPQKPQKQPSDTSLGAAVEGQQKSSSSFWSWGRGNSRDKLGTSGAGKSGDPGKGKGGDPGKGKGKGGDEGKGMDPKGDGKGSDAALPEFTVFVSKESGRNLGLKIAKAIEANGVETMPIQGVDNGIISNWNSTAADDEKVKPGDCLKAVNGVMGYKAMTDELKRAKELHMIFVRGGVMATKGKGKG